MREPTSPAPDRSEEERRWSEWMARAQGGDREAYASLMSELGSAVESFVRVRFGSLRDAAFLEDCVQESLLTVHRVRHTWDRRLPFRPWLFAIVRHKVIDLLRRRAVRRGEEPPREEPAHESDPAAGLDGARLLAGLEPAYREALVLTKLEGWSLEEAATRAGVTTGAMKTRVHRALRLLQKRLREEGLP
jgi:RNA polymerase sigma-70 factor (ECF subfamily)